MFLTLTVFSDFIIALYIVTMPLNCHICTGTRQLWFKNTTTKIVKQDEILCTGTFMWCTMEKQISQSFSLQQNLLQDQWIFYLLE